MCGRFAMTTDPARLAEQLQAVNEIPAVPAPAPNYNVAPTSAVATVVCRHGDPEDEPTRRIRLMRWGLVPPWVKAGPDGAPAGGGPLLINARAETVLTSPVFRVSAAQRRCLVPMDGFYEWRVNPNTPDGRKAGKTPYYISGGDGQTLFAAGLWSMWRVSRSASPLLSCTIVTTAAVGKLAGIHDRMPLLLAEPDFDGWLGPDAPLDPALLTRPPELAPIAVREVSPLVNSVRNDGPKLIVAAEPQPEQATLL